MGLRDVLTRSIRPPEQPNSNDPVEAAPGTVGPPSATGGDPDGVVVTSDEDGTGWRPPPRIMPSAWSGWPADWSTPSFGEATGVEPLVGVAWACVDLNSNVLSTMPPYLVGAAPSLNADWLRNPDPDIYTSWEEFAKQLFWEFQQGEAFVLSTARYSTGQPARFHIPAPWAVEVVRDDAGMRRYLIGKNDVTADICHIRYQSTLIDLHGHGPLQAAGANLTAAAALAAYATSLVAGGGIPPSILKHEDELNATQSAELKAQWMQARMSSLGEPAVLSGGVTWEPVAVDPAKLALHELSQFNESRIAVLLGVPPFLVGLPSGGDSLTYSTVQSIFDYHWRAHLRPRAQIVMSALSEFLLPRGTTVELNRDEYVRPGLYERAQSYQILAGIIDPATGQPAITVDEIRNAERLNELDERLAGVLG